MDALPTFSDLIVAHRGARTQDAFRDLLSAGGCRMTRQTISKWEKGRSCPPGPVIFRFSFALKLPAADRTALLEAAARFERVRK